MVFWGGSGAAARACAKRMRSVPVPLCVVGGPSTASIPDGSALDPAVQTCARQAAAQLPLSLHARAARSHASHAAPRLQHACSGSATRVTGPLCDWPVSSAYFVGSFSGPFGIVFEILALSTDWPFDRPFTMRRRGGGQEGRGRRQARTAPLSSRVVISSSTAPKVHFDWRLYDSANVAFTPARSCGRGQRAISQWYVYMVHKYGLTHALSSDCIRRQQQRRAAPFSRPRRTRQRGAGRGAGSGPGSRAGRGAGRRAGRGRTTHTPGTSSLRGPPVKTGLSLRLLKALILKAVRCGSLSPQQYGRTYSTLNPRSVRGSGRFQGSKFWI